MKEGLEMYLAIRELCQEPFQRLVALAPGLTGGSASGGGFHGFWGFLGFFRVF